MAAGAWVATSSEAEVRATETGRRRFMGESVTSDEAGDTPMASALVVGASYFAGALVPVLPVLAGASTALPSLVAAGNTIVLVSVILAFLSGMGHVVMMSGLGAWPRCAIFSARTGQITQ